MRCEFVIPLVINMDGQCFEIYCIVCDMMDSVSLIWGFKNIMEVEGIFCSRSMQFKSLNRSPFITPTEEFTIRPGEIQDVKLLVNFPEEITGMVIIKMLTSEKPKTLKAHVVRNHINMKVLNRSHTILKVPKDQVIRTLDVHSIGYFNVTMEQFRSSLLNDYQFESLHYLCNSYNQLIDDINDKTKPLQLGTKADPYPWLEPNDPHRSMSDEEILDKSIDLSKSCLDKNQKDKLMALIKKYKAAFSLRDEIGECPNTKVDIEVDDDMPFFVQPFFLAKKEKSIIDKQMNRLVSLGILSKNNTSHTSPVMLITRKATNAKRPVVDFCLLNTRIRRCNTATPLLRDIFSIIIHSKSEIISCVDIKDEFHSIRLTD